MWLLSMKDGNGSKLEMAEIFGVGAPTVAIRSFVYGYHNGFFLNEASATTLRDALNEWLMRTQSGGRTDPGSPGPDA